MVFRFLLISDEVIGFKREIQINSDDTFYDLHKAIIKSVAYQEEDMTSFVMCTDGWEHREEIALLERDTYSDEDSFTMEDTVLDEFLVDEKQRLMYIFDYPNQRGFFMELREIILGKRLESTLCTQSEKDAPIQFLKIEEEVVAKPVITPQMIEEDELYGDDGVDDDSEELIETDDEDFDMDELDADGFDGLDQEPTSSEEDNQ